ncbi:uncharacterized protein TNCV_2256721 [Trichonephila clavipes]|nr:uncharacterized protein TNCV_2256721 [Trichonephila clavipes]
MFDHYLAEYLWSLDHSLSDETFFESSCYTLPSTWEGSTIRKSAQVEAYSKPQLLFQAIKDGHGSRVVKVSDRGWICHGARIFTPVVSFSFEHHAGDRVTFARFHPNLEGENPGGGQGPPTSLSLSPTTTREDLRFEGYLEYSHAARKLYIYKHPCLLRDSVSTAPQSVSLATMLVGRQKKSCDRNGWC